MPSKSKKPCAQFGCAALVEIGTSYCTKHKREKYKQYIKSDYQKLYNCHRWVKLRKGFLLKNPFCVICGRTGFVSKSTTVDHMVDHKGDLTLFWDVDNMQALCTPCHNRKTRQTVDTTRL